MKLVRILETSKPVIGELDRKESVVAEFTDDTGIAAGQNEDLVLNFELPKNDPDVEGEVDMMDYYRREDWENLASRFSCTI